MKCYTAIALYVVLFQPHQVKAEESCHCVNKKNNNGSNSNYENGIAFPLASLFIYKIVKFGREHV